MKVIVMGGGIAGLSMMHELRRRGITEVTVLEKTSEYRAVGAGIHLSAWALRLMDANGTGAAVREAGIPYRARCLYDAGGSLIGTIDLDGIARRHERALGVIIRRSALHEALMRGLPRERVLNGVAVTSIDLRPDGVRLETERHGDFEADLLVGCDGLHSQVREQLFNRVSHAIGKRTYRAVVAGGDGIDAFEVYRGHGSSIGLSPMGHDQLNMWISVPADPGDPDPLAEGGIEAFTACFTEYTAPRVRAALDQLHDPGQVLMNDLHEVAMEWWWRDRAVLCGDASHAMSPSTGTGATCAIEDVFVLARELGRVSAGEQSYDAALNAYYVERLKRVEGIRVITRINDYEQALHSPELRRLRDERDAAVLSDPDAFAFEVTESLDPWS